MTAARLPWLTGMLIGICCFLAVIAPLPEDVEAARTDALFWLLVLNADEPLAVWRWAFAHLLHTGGMHLLWNMLALLVLGVLIEQSSRGRQTLLVGAGVGALAVALWFHGLAASSYYCGLSGVLNTLFVLALAAVHRSAAAGERAGSLRAVLSILLLGAFAKAGYELWLGTPLLPQQHWPAAPGAHLTGLVAGVLLALAHRPLLTGR